MINSKDKIAQFIKNNQIIFIKYVVVGSVITLLDLSLVYFFKEVVSLQVVISASFAFIIANLVSFILNKFWTFKNYSQSFIRQYLKFLFTALFGLLLTIILMWLFYEKLNLFHTIINKNYLLCKLLVSGIIMFWNFLVNRLWTFSLNLKLNFETTSRSQNYNYYLSIVIPAYNESTRIEKTLSNMLSYLMTKDFKWEIVIVDDGSTDNTYQLLRKKYSNYDNIKIIRNPENHGKGYSVKMGVLNSSGRYILFSDADNSTPIEEFEKFEPKISKDEILIGSRYKQEEDQIIKSQPLYRIIISRIGNFLIKLFLFLDIQDTQCGFKLFPADLAHYIFNLQTIEGFGFDMEILALAYLGDIEIEEIPVNWFDSEETRVRPIKNSFNTFIDLLNVKIKIWLNYYQRKLRELKSKENI